MSRAKTTGRWEMDDRSLEIQIHNKPFFGDFDYRTFYRFFELKFGRKVNFAWVRQFTYEKFLSSPFQKISIVSSVTRDEKQKKKIKILKESGHRYYWTLCVT